MKEGLKRTKYGIFYKTLTANLLPILPQLAGKKVLDLGSGDNEVVNFLRANNVDAYGVEVDPQFTDTPKDMLSLYWDEYDYVYYYIKGCAQENLVAAKMNREAKKAIIYHNDVRNEDLQTFMNSLKMKLVAEYDNIKIYDSNRVS